MIGWLRHRTKLTENRAEAPLEPALFAALEPEEFLALENELEGLGSLRVPAAARERGWVLVRREVEARQARGGFRTQAQVRPRRGWRGVAAAALTALALVLGSLGIHSLANLRVAGEGTAVTTVASAAGSSGATTGQLPGTSGTAGGPTSSDIMPPTSAGGGSVTSGSGGVPSQSTQQSPITTGATSDTTLPSTTGRTTVTTQQSTSTSRQVMTKEERQDTAIGVVSYVAQAVIAGNSVDAASQVAPEASANLTQLMASLENPSGYSVQPLGDAAGEDVRVVLTIEDNRPDGQGGFTTATVRFVVSVRLLSDEARIVAIYSAP